MKHGLKKYIVFWLSQFLFQLESAMTCFTLILWAYEQNGSAMTVSLMSFFNYVPYIIASVFAGSFVDSHSKKKSCWNRTVSLGFARPASAVAIGRIKQVSEMNAFSDNLVAVISPVLAAAVFAFGGAPQVIIIDLMSFVFAFAVLAFVIKIPEEKRLIRKEHL